MFFFQFPYCNPPVGVVYYCCFPRGRHDNKNDKNKDKTMINETITLNDKIGLEIDFTRIEYKDSSFNGPHWMTANIPPAEIRSLCGKKGTGYFTVTEDEVESALVEWLQNHLTGEVATFNWQWDTYHAANVA